MIDGAKKIPDPTIEPITIVATSSGPKRRCSAGPGDRDEGTGDWEEGPEVPSLRVVSCRRFPLIPQHLVKRGRITLAPRVAEVSGRYGSAARGRPD
jgi:hypothetical protein